MIRSVLRPAFAGLLAVSAFVAVPSPAVAIDVDLGFLKHWLGPPPLSIPEMHRLTPRCGDDPSAAWKGRVSGNSEGTYNDAAQAVSLVGCFPTLQDCTLWRMRMTGSMQGRILYNECSER